MGNATTATPAGAGFVLRNEFVLRRLHSLAGVVPLALFMIEHMISNAKSTQGPAAYHGAVDFLTSLPGLYLIEIGLIFLPLLFHGVFGVWIWTTGKSNLAHFRHTANWRYSVQRWSGVFVLFFVVYHLLHWRFGVQFPWQGDGFGIVHYTTLTAENGAAAGGSFFAAMAAEFSRVPMFVFYVLGLAATMYHLANGLWTFAITWGLTRTRAAQKRWGYVCAGLGVALFVAGVFGLVGFVAGGPIGVVQPVK